MNFYLIPNCIIFFKNSFCGLTSKTLIDAKAAFTDMVSFGYRQLPVFLKPKQLNNKDSVSELVFAHKSVEVESSDSLSPLSIFRKALALRKELIAPEELTWHETGDKHVLHFSRPNGWHCITNFGFTSYPIPAGLSVLHSSTAVEGDLLPGAATIWLKG